MPDRPPPHAVDLVVTALGRALDEVVRTGGPLVPMAMQPADEGVHLHRFDSDRIEQGLVEARETLAGIRGDWVLVWDGYLTIDEWRTDALYAHLEVDGEGTAHLFAWRYGEDEDGEVVPLEPTIYLGEDGRYGDPGRSHPLPPEEGSAAPHGQVLRKRRRWFRRS